jgi:hypothetical protein
MSRQSGVKEYGRRPDDARERLLAGIPVTERRQLHQFPDRRRR